MVHDACTHQVGTQHQILHMYTIQLRAQVCDRRVDAVKTHSGLPIMLWEKLKFSNISLIDCFSFELSIRNKKEVFSITKRSVATQI